MSTSESSRPEPENVSGRVPGDISDRPSGRSDEFLTALAARVLRDSVTYCELVAARGDEPRRYTGGCPRKVAAVKWEDGFLDIICDVHALDAERRGVEVIWGAARAPKNADGGDRG